MIEVTLLMVKLAATLAPKLTTVAPVKLVPLIVIVVPPTVVPDVGDIDVTVGAGHADVVNVASLPFVVFTLLVALTLKW